MSKIDLYHGCRVQYKGYKTLQSGETVDAICFATVIGWDELFIYTTFKDAGTDRGKCYYYDPEIILPHMVWLDSRIGFHRSRLINVLEDIKIPINHNLTQQSLFTNQ